MPGPALSSYLPPARRTFSRFIFPHKGASDVPSFAAALRAGRRLLLALCSGVVVLAPLPAGADPTAFAEPSFTIEAPQPTREIDVRDTKGLIAALRDSHGGERILLAPGNYEEARLINGQQGMSLDFDVPVTIASADPVHPAKFEKLALHGVRNMILDGLLLQYRFALGDDNLTRPFLLHNSNRIVLRNTRIIGDRAYGMAPDDEGFGMATGIDLRNSTETILEHNEFTTFYRGLLISKSQGVIVRNNDIHGTRSEGINLAQVDDLLIADNHIHDLEVSPSSGDHRDMIQFWSANSGPSSRITIRDNLLDSGAGLYTQSIFVGNELMRGGKGGPEMLHHDLLIERNVIINAHLHGITVESGRDITIRRNTLIHNAGSDGPGGSRELWTPRIRLTNPGPNVLVADNITSSIDLPNGPGHEARGNLLIQDASPSQPGWYGKVFLGAQNAVPGQLTSYLYLPDGPAGQGQIGAPALNLEGSGRDFPRGGAGPLTALANLHPGPSKSSLPDADPSTSLTATPAINMPQPLIHTTAVPLQPGTFHFSAAESRLPDGLGPVRYLWTLSSNTTAQGKQAEVQGPEIEHRFTKPGQYDVTLVMVLPDGSRLETSSRVTIPDPLLLDFRPETGFTTAPARPGGPRIIAPTTGVVPGTGPIQLSGNKPIELSQSLISDLFGAPRFALTLRFRAGRQGGEMLRIHTLLSIALTQTGGIRVQLFPEGRATPLTVDTGPRRLYDKAWHDLRLSYSAGNELRLELDGHQVARQAAGGPLGQAKHWGLSLGNPFGGAGFAGEIEMLAISTDPDYLRPPQN